MGERTSHSKFIPNKRADISKKKNSILSIQEEIKATHKKTKQAEEDTARFTREMESKQLDKVKMDGERQVAAKKKSLEAEIQRNRGVKDSVQVARANSGAYAQQIAEKVRLFVWCVFVFILFAYAHFSVMFTNIHYTTTQQLNRQRNKCLNTAVISPRNKR